jgi:hypothetical protein
VDFYTDIPAQSRPLYSGEGESGTEEIILPEKAAKTISMLQLRGILQVKQQGLYNRRMNDRLDLQRSSFANSFFNRLIGFRGFSPGKCIHGVQPAKFSIFESNLNQNLYET